MTARNRRSISLFQALRNRRSTCFEFWEFGDPFVAKVQNRRSTRFSTAESQSNYSHISKPDHSLCEIADPLVSGSDHNRITATPHTNHSRISTAAVAQPQDSRITTSEKSPIHLFQAWVAAEEQPYCSRNHSHITAASEPDHSLWEIADPLISSPDHTRITATSHSNHSCITALSQPQDTRFRTSEK